MKQLLLLEPLVTCPNSYLLRGIPMRKLPRYTPPIRHDYDTPHYTLYTSYSEVSSYNLSRGIEGASHEVTGIPHEGYRVYLSEGYGAGCSAGEEVWAQRWQDLLGYSREDNGRREAE